MDAAGIAKFETAEHDTAEAQQEVTYGLVKRSRPGQGDAPAQNGSAGLVQQHQAQQQAQDGPASAAAEAAAAAGAAGGSALGAKLLADRESQQLREDIASLPQQASLEAYEAMPVEHFGMALLRQACV